MQETQVCSLGQEDPLVSKDVRWGYFPSVSAGWTVSNEPFFRDNINGDVFNFLKFRASWGRNGNVNVLSGYPYMETISKGSAWYQYDTAGDRSYGSGPSGLSKVCAFLDAQNHRQSELV